MDVAAAVFQGTHRLQDALLQGAAYAHHLSGGLHLRAELIGGLGELVEGEARHLGHHVVDCGLAAGGSAGNGDFVQGEPHRYLCRHAGYGEAAGLRSEGRRTRHAGVDFYQVVLERQRVQGELHVAAAGDSQGAYELQGGVAKELVFLVREGLCGRDHDGVAGVDAHGIDVLHAAHGNGGVGGVAHNLELYFLISLDALFHEHLMHGGEGKRCAHQVAQLFFVVGKAAAGAAERESGAQDHRVADLGGHTHAVLYAVADFRRNHGLAYADAELLELFAVFGLLDAFEGGAEYLHAAFFEYALAGQLHGEVEAGLAAEPGHYGVRTLVAYDLGYVLKLERLHIHLVGDMGVGHDGGGVGVDQNHLVALFLERQAGLGAGIVEFSGLSDDDRTGAYHHNFAYVSSSGHFSGPPSF